MLFSKPRIEKLEVEHVTQIEDNIEQIYNKVYLYIKNSNELNLIERGKKTKNELFNEIKEELHEKNISDENVFYILKKLNEEIWQYGILNDLIEKNPDITDIKLMKFNNIRVKRRGKREKANVEFNNSEEMEEYIKKVARRNKIPLAQINSQVTFTDKDTYSDYILRITIFEKYINSVDNSYMHIRKSKKEKYTMNDLEELKMFDKQTKEYLIKKMQHGKSMIIVGKGSSGKTTLFNALIDELPEDRAGFIIQENEELFTDTHPEIMFLHITLGSGDNKITYDLQELAKYGLVADTDLFGVGEIKGAEAKYLLNAFYTGYTGVSTLHGESSTEGINKLVDYMKYGTDYSRTDLLRMLQTIDSVIYMEDFKVKEISEVIGFDETIGNLIYKKVLEGGQKIKI